MRGRALLGLLAGAACFANPGSGISAEPLSAIPWLSQSIVLEAAPPPPRGGGGGAADPDGITVTRLGAVSSDAVGLLAPDATGFSRDLWGDAPLEEVRGQVLAKGGQGVPEAIALFRRLMLAEADPPAGSDPGSSLLVARIDRLLQMGALEEAEAMIETAGPDSPDLFRRWFDIGLLLGRAQPPCAALRDNPALSPTLPARVFCLARGGDWNAAEITLTLGNGVGSIPEDQKQLLARFLDPEVFEAEPDPPIPDPLTPLDFLLREAVGLPRPAGPLPLAFLQSDLSPDMPMRGRIEAAERLVLAGGLPEPALFEAYRAGEPAASGGLWDRAKAVQQLDAALVDGTPDQVATALARVDALLSPRGLRVALAREYGAELARLDPGQLRAPARGTLAELLLLAGQPEPARAAAGPAPDARLVALVALAEGGDAPATDDARIGAAADGLAQARPRDEREQQLAALADGGRQGETILAALDLLAGGTAADPQAIHAALFALGRAGQGPAARAIALQTLLPGPGG